MRPMERFARGLASLVLVCAAALGVGTILADATVTFDNGAEGWDGPQGPGGATTIDPAGGNPGANLHTVFNDFGITFHNDTSADFIGDYTTSTSVTLAVDVKVESIAFFGTPVSRPWLVDLRDYDDPEPGYLYTSVWFKFADISEAEHGDWTHFAVTIADTSATALPAGWGGTGAENEFAEPVLPPDRTFTDVLAGIDEIVLTTLEPGFFFGFTDHDVRLDNVAIERAGGPGGPGEVPELRVFRSIDTPGALVLTWSPSCSPAVEDYGIHQGLIGTWYSHRRVVCTDLGNDRSETLVPAAGNTYYLVVPLDAADEGSYGTDSAHAPRPAGTLRCRPTQNAQPCP